MKHKFLALILALAATLCLCFGLVACDKTGGGQTAGGGQTNETAGGETEKDTAGDETEKDTAGDETEKDTEEKGIAGTTFVFYDITCEGMDEALLQEYKQRNLSQKCTFNDDGTAVMTASAGGANLAYTLTYTVNGNDVTLTVTALTVNGEASPLHDPAPTMQCTYDGTNFVMLSPLQDGSTLHLIMHEKAAE